MTEHFDEKSATWDDDAARVERAARVARRIMERIPLTAEMDVLDFGSGTGLLGFNLLPRVASVTFADPSEGMLGWLALSDLDTEDGGFHDDPSAAAHHGLDRAELLALVERAGLERGEVGTVHTMRVKRGAAVCEYPLFLLTARQPARR